MAIYQQAGGMAAAGGVGMVGGTAGVYGGRAAVGGMQGAAVQGGFVQGGGVAVGGVQGGVVQGGGVAVGGGAAGGCCAVTEDTCAAVVCAGAAGPAVMTFVGYGGGDYVTETTYKYVGAGQGNLAYLAPARNIWGRVGFVVGALALIASLVILLWPTGTTTTTTPPPPMGECTFWGDPHLKTFDGGRPSFYGEGEAYIVKSSEIMIQGRYMGTKYTKGLAATNMIAVGGEFLQGHVVEVGTMESGVLTVDGNPVCSTFPSTYDLEGIATLTYSAEGTLVDEAASVWEKHIVHMDLPMGVSITVYRWSNYIDLRITMPAQPGMDGSCGNFNGDSSDDSTEAIQKRVGARVAPGDLIFHSRTTITVTAEENKLIQMCPPEKYARARRECAGELRGAHITNQNKACLLNVCYGSNEHALKYAKSLGL